MVKVRTLRWGDYPGLPRWAQGITKVLIRGRQGGQSSREGNMMMEPEVIGPGRKERN